MRSPLSSGGVGETEAWQDDDDEGMPDGGVVVQHAEFYFTF